MSDDFTQDTLTTGVVSVGDSATGDIETRGDIDWFEVTLQAGQTYRFDLEGSPTGAGTLSDPNLLGVYDNLGQLIPDTDNDDGGAWLNSRLYFTASRYGTYHVAVGAWGGKTGSYKLLVEEVTHVEDYETDTVPPTTGSASLDKNVDDYPANTGSAGTLAVGSSATGGIERAGDADWFAVELVAGRVYRIDLEGTVTGQGTLVDPYLRGIYRADGSLPPDTDNNDGGDWPNSRAYFLPTSSGTYFIAAGANTEHTGTYRLSVQEIVDDYPAESGTTGTVAVGGPATGAVDYAGDEDWFAVELVADTHYRIHLEGSATHQDALEDPFLRGVHDAAGNLLAGTGNDDAGAGHNSQVDIVAPESGTYYIAAGAYHEHTGAYRLSVEEVADDYSVAVAGSGALTVGGLATGEIERAGDEDWFAIELIAGRDYQLDLEGWWTGQGALRDPYLRGIHDAAGNLLAFTADDDGGERYNSRLDFTAPESGTFYIAAGANAAHTGTYRLSVQEIVDDYSAFSAGTTGTVAVGGTAMGKVDHAGDEDWFAVELVADTHYRIYLEGSPTHQDALEDPFLRGVHDAAGNLLAGTGDDGGTGFNSRLEFIAPESGTYYIAAGAHHEHTGAYRLSVEEVADDYSVAVAGSGALTVGGLATGEIERAGDEDWFAIELIAGRDYQLDLEGWWTGQGALRDPYLRGIHDAAGNLIAGTADDDGGERYNSRLEFTASESGTYYIAAGAYREHTGDYRLTVADAADDYSASSTGTTGTVVVDGSATGKVDYAGDEDWFAVELVAGREYQVYIEGSPTDQGTLSDPVLYGIHDAGGNLIAGTGDDDVGERPNSRLDFTAPVSGTYYIAAGAYDEHIGDYLLSVEDPGDDYPASFAGTTGTVAVGGSAAGEVDYAGDEDWFAVELVAGQDYQIDLEASPTDRGSLGDPFLYGIHDLDGNLLPNTSNDDGGTDFNSRLEFTAPESDTYYIAAGAFGDDTGDYRLTVDYVTDNYPASTGTTGTVVVGGSAAGEVDYAGDEDWFAVELVAGREYQIHIEGSPTDRGTLGDPTLYGIHDLDGNLLENTGNDDGGIGFNSRLEFTAPESGTYYIAVGAFGEDTGTYTVEVADLL